MLKNVSPELIENVKELKIALNELTVHDLSVYSMSELYYKVAHKLNEVINELSRFEGVLSDEVIKQNEKLIYLLGEGLENEVIKNIDRLIEHNFFKEIINEKIFSDLNDKIDTFKSEVDSQLDQKTNKSETDNIQTQINNLVLGAVGDGNNAEVVQARGVYPLLNDRLNNNDLIVDVIKNRQVTMFDPVNELPNNLQWGENDYMWDHTGNIVWSAYASTTQALKTKLHVIEGFTYEFNRFQGNYYLYDENGENGIQYSNTSPDPLRITIPKGRHFIGINVDTSSMGLELTYFNRLTPKLNEEKKCYFRMPKLMLDNDQIQFPKKLDNKKIVNLGDSIFGNIRPPYDVSSKLSEITGATVYNCGFGGTNAGRHSNKAFDPISLYRLVDAITSKNWSLQDENINGDGTLSYFSDTLNLLKSLDFNNIDIVTISHGTNDFGNGLQPKGYKNDESNRFLYYDGALSYAIEKLLSTFPHLQIFLVTPHYRFIMDSNNSFIEDSNTWELDSWVGQGGKNKLTDFVEACKDVAKEYQIPVIDNYFELGINKYNRHHYFPVADGTHHNQNGRDLIAKHISKELY